MTVSTPVMLFGEVEQPGSKIIKEDQMRVLYCQRHKQLAQVAWACPESDGFCNAVPMRLIPDNAETRWLCDYPEFGDDACMVDHDPVSTRQPRKHTTCGWFLTVPTFVDAALDGETP